MTFDLRFHIRQTVATILLLAATMLSGCSEEMPLIGGSSDHQGVTLMIPAAPQFAGAQGDASHNATADELRYTSLTFFAFPQGKGEVCAISLMDKASDGISDNQMAVTSAYRQYTVPLEEGTYRFYLVANYFSENDVLPQTEGSLKEKLVSYAENFTGAMPEAGLPMSADHSDFRDKESGTYFSADGTYDYNGSATTLYADMTFACAKVTLEAQDFADKPTRIKNINLINFSNNVPLLYQANYEENYGTIGSLDNPWYASEAEESESIPEGISFYVPERYVKVGNEIAQSSLTFSVNPGTGDREISLPLGEKPGTSAYNPETGAIAVPGEEELRELRRGTHYIYRLNPLAEVSLQIEEWNPVKLAYALRGPVYLHVERQSYPITAGSKTAIWYDSDVPRGDIHFESPIFYPPTDGDPLPLYNFSIDETSDTIRVWVNENIKSIWYDQITAESEKTKYDYFHIVAGPIHKRIMVDPLDLSYYLYVTPVEIPINARIRIASGEYSGSIPVEIRTNYPYIRIKRTDGWDNNLLQGANSNLLTLTDADKQNTNGEAIEVGFDTDSQGYESLAANGFRDTSTTLTTLNVNFSGLNSGADFWKNSYELTFTVEGSIDGTTPATDPIPVHIFTTPNVLNYKIHFHADGWEKPHIYVYQCLEFPATWNQKFYDIPMASKPIGYYDGYSYLASLEYSFTGKIAFKGWDDPINSSALYQDNGTPTDFHGTYERGFFIFDDNTGSWRIDDKNTWAIVRYNLDMDFCKEHREEIKGDCSLCASETDYHKVFPGVQMKKEKDNDGWWYFELTGVAVPGRSLIMFADGHNSNPDGSWSRRFPAEKSNSGDNAPVGLTLFDYPDREGWLWFNGDDHDRINNVFTSEAGKYRIYWPKSKYGQPKNRIHLWLVDASNYELGDIVPGGWSNRPFGITFSEDDKYYHFDFISLPNPGNNRIRAIITEESDGGSRIDFGGNSWSMSTFISGSDGYKSAYFDITGTNEGILRPGTPPTN